MTEKETCPSDIFLATTNHIEHWDTTRPIFLLGEWCIPYDKQEKIIELNCTLIDDYYNEDIYDEKTRESQQFIDKILPILCESLLTIHGEKLNPNYWEFIIYDWLSHFIQIIYDRYILLTNVVDKCPKVKLIGTDPYYNYIPIDTEEFLNLSGGSDDYNLLLFSKIQNFLQIPFLPVSLKKINESDNCGSSFKAEIISKIYQLSQKVYAQLKKPKDGDLCFILSGFSAKNIWILSLMVPSLYNLNQNAMKNFYNKRYDYDNNTRHYLSRMLNEKLEFFTEFEKLLLHLIPFELPILFIEKYYEIKKKFETTYPLNLKYKAVFSCYYSLHDMEKIFAAIIRKNGGKILWGQHGGGTEYRNLIETRIPDIYYTWGWEKAGTPNIRKISAPKLIGRKKIGANNHNNDILYNTNSFPRYKIRFHPSIFYSENHFLLIYEFINSLTDVNKKNLCVRHYMNDYGRGNIEKLIENFPIISHESTKISFYKRLKKCRLFVCDHISTTYLEALYANVPTIIFFDKSIWRIPNEAKKLFENLKNVGILYDTPKEAAFAVNLIYPDIELWWNNLDRQKAVREFISAFTYVSDNPLHEWKNELQKL